jgi:hypothetical protein
VRARPRRGARGPGQGSGCGGYFGDDLGADHPGLECPVLKPFTAEELAARVREALGAAAAAPRAEHG